MGGSGNKAGESGKDTSKNEFSLRTYLNWGVVVDRAVKGAICLNGERHRLRPDPLQLVQRLALGVPPKVLPLLIEAEVGGPL